ncbi:hypothetical protein [Lentzea atacamensis]|uniref:hypothetical protein n=1 Tax=Lentzea atacamensis TaxID=531938 RepID=UPI00147342CA|nr:hypothetical protein [Lentzea atacamensis]
MDLRTLLQAPAECWWARITPRADPDHSLDLAAERALGVAASTVWFSNAAMLAPAI